MIGKARDAMATQQLHQVLQPDLGGGGGGQPLFRRRGAVGAAKTDPQRMGTILYVTAEVIRQVAILAQPFMPASAGKLLDLLGVPAGERDFTALGGRAPHCPRRRSCRRRRRCFRATSSPEAKAAS